MRFLLFLYDEKSFISCALQTRVHGGAYFGTTYGLVMGWLRWLLVAIIPSLLRLQIAFLLLPYVA